MGDHAEQQGMHFDPATMQMFQAFALFMQQQHAMERREILATKAIQAVVNKMDQFAEKDVTKYLCEYVKEMELHRVSEGEMIQSFELVVVSKIRKHVRAIRDPHGRNWEELKLALKEEYFMEDSERVTKRTFLEWAPRTPTQTQKASSQSLQSPRRSRSYHLQRRETSHEQRSNDTKGKAHVVEQPPASIGHRQPSTHGLVNGHDSNEQTMRQTIPMPMSNPGCFGGGSVFQAMIRPSPALHGFKPDNAYGAMHAGSSNPMYGNISVQPGRAGGNSGSGMPLLNAPAYDNLKPKEKPIETSSQV
ncbi:hypothetical protein L7F22_015668 [Adiantum nelumboides]|nr:hypothetical protein [Adiantum nelumboides]